MLCYAPRMGEVTVAPGSQASLREANTARVVDALKQYGRLTQVEIASATGLSPATVSNIVRQLLSERAVETTATTRSGRRAQQVNLVRSSSMAIGVHIGPRAMDLTLTDTTLDAVERLHLPLPADHRFDTTLDRAALLTAEMADASGAGISDVAAVGVAMPSSLRRGPNGFVGLDAWEDIDVAAVLGTRLGRKVVVAREVDAAAVAEARLGSLKGVGLGLYVRVGESTDSAVVSEGTVLRGAPGIGHVQAQPAGAICRCGGRGCLNTLTSIQAMQELLRISHGALQLRDIVQLANRGDRGCLQVIRDVGQAIGVAIGDVASVIGPDAIVVGGPLAATGEALLRPIREALASRPVLPDSGELLVASVLDGDIESLGVSALAHDSVDQPSVRER